MSAETFAAKVAETLLEPFASPENFLRAASGLTDALTDLGSKTAWPWVVSSLVLALVLYAVGKRRGAVDSQTSLRAFLAPRGIYGQRSAVLDYKYVAINYSIRGIVYTPLMAGSSLLLYKLLQPLVVGTLTIDVPLTNPFIRGVLLTIFAVLLADFGWFLSHYLMHKIPLLWYFHEVHHSAEVLTPVTVYRVHPLEDFVNAYIGSLLGGLGAAIYAVLSRGDVTVITIFGVNVVIFAFHLFAFQLRHSHIWLSYGPLMNRIFISPAQHQIHHSLDPKHWSRNYGFIFAVWDGLFGSLYVPRSREILRLGVPTDPGDFSSVSKLYFLPFAKAGRAVVQKFRTARALPES